MESSTASPPSPAPALAVSAPREAPAAPLDEPGSRQRGAVLSRLLCLGDLAAATIAAAVVVVALGLTSPSALVFVALAGMLWPLSAFSFGLYRGDDLHAWASGVQEVPRVLVTLLLTSWPLFGAATVLGLDHAATLAFATVATTAALGAVARTAVRTVLHHSPQYRQRTLVLGSGLVAGQIVEKIGNNTHFGLDPVGMVDDDFHDVGSPDLPWLGRFSDLESVLAEQRIDRVIIAFSRASHEQLLESIRACRDSGVAIDVIPRLFEFLDGVRALDQVGGLPLLSIGTPRLTRASTAAKRTLDVVVSLVALIVLSPLLLLIAVAIKIDSRGPVFFRQLRSGRGTSSFRLIKFRSMHTDAEQRKTEIGELNESRDGVMFKIRRDPRVTRVGRVLRRFSLDELPQLFNVLIGEMSLVGPRPLIFPETAALEEDWHLRRHELRPGITGPWQVYGRSQTPFQEMVRFDYQYVAGWSLSRDVEILCATIPAVVSGRGAY